MPVQAKKKGNRGELECSKLLNEKFGEKIFTRTQASGGYIGGGNRKNSSYLTEEQQLAFVSDLVCPIWFRFVIEHKSYADKAVLWDFFNESSDVNKWFKQVENDASFVKKQPLLIVKYNQHKRICWIKEKLDFYIFEYKGWYCYNFSDLLNLPNEFFRI